jgi:hypothetical protein
MTAMSLTRRIANVGSIYSRYLAEKPRQQLRSAALDNLIKFKLIEHGERSMHLASLGATDAQIFQSSRSCSARSEARPFRNPSSPTSLVISQIGLQ